MTGDYRGCFLFVGLLFQDSNLYAQTACVYVCARMWCLERVRIREVNSVQLDWIVRLENELTLFTLINLRPLSLSLALSHTLSKRGGKSLYFVAMAIHFKHKFKLSHTVTTAALSRFEPSVKRPCSRLRSLKSSMLVYRGKILALNQSICRQRSPRPTDENNATFIY